jgi:hypothetical protein
VSPKPNPALAFPERVRDWLEDHRPVIDALALLRHGDAEAEAIELLLDFRPVRLLRLSWELWPEIGLDPEVDTEALLAATLRPELVALCRFALWGQEPAEGWTALHLAP